MNNLEIREIEIPSPIESLKVGDDFSYKGQYKDGYEEGISKIKRLEERYLKQMSELETMYLSGNCT